MVSDDRGRRRTFAPIHPKGSAIRIVFSSGGNRGRVAFFIFRRVPAFSFQKLFPLDRWQLAIRLLNQILLFISGEPYGDYLIDLMTGTFRRL